MKQLVLPLAPDFLPSLGNFVAGRNGELLDILRSLPQSAPAERFVYLWGAPGCGRSHLLRAAVAEAVACGLAAAYVEDGDALMRVPESCDFLAVDDVERLDEAAQIALFNHYNRLREGFGRLLAAGPCAPAQLDLRQDVVTRLGWGLAYQVQTLADEEKAAALQSHAAQRGFAFPLEAVQYLLNHWRRDLPSLLAALDALDRYSLESKRPVTVPLLREILRQA